MQIIRSRTIPTQHLSQWLDARSTRRLAQVAGWVLIAVIVFVTLGPLQDRPRTGHAQLERFAAYLMLATAFAIAYPRRLLWVAGILTVLAIGLELAQFLAPNRDPGMTDAMAKVAGVLTGVGLVRGMQATLRIAKL